MTIDRSILESIRDSWKLDAKSENSNRYFFHVREVQAIQAGDKAFVIGRKGTGKTAIAQHLSMLHSHDTFSVLLSFKNFPFNELYALKNSGFTSPNQFISLWKYLIYSHVARMMAANENINIQIREPLSRLYKKEPIEYLEKSVGKWTGTDFNFSVLGTGLGVKSQYSKAEATWIDKSLALEELIAQHIDESSYLILFDELDEDFRYMTETDRYENFTDLLTGLFKAIQDIKSIFRTSRAKIFPVAFLRDDIYDALEDPDKTKWDDAKIDLDWTVSMLKELLAFRISRTANELATDICEFDTAWASIFQATDISHGTQQLKRQSTFEFILKSTQMRPRDLTRYLTEYASAYLRWEGYAGEAVVKAADHAFSNYLRRELQDELGGVVPHAKRILDVLSSMRRQTFKFADFERAYNDAIDVEVAKKFDAVWIVKVLFYFSVIGNQPPQNNQIVFRYKNRGAQINLRESLIVHRGLLKSLQIL